MFPQPPLGPHVCYQPARARDHLIKGQVRRLAKVLIAQHLRKNIQGIYAPFDPNLDPTMSDRGSWR
jgi:hypothetical protein